MSISIPNPLLHNINHEPAITKNILNSFFRQVFWSSWGFRDLSWAFPFLLAPGVERVCSLIIYLESNSNNHLKIIMICIASHLTWTFSLNYSEIPNSWGLFLPRNPDLSRCSIVYHFPSTLSQNRKKYKNSHSGSNHCGCQNSLKYRTLKEGVHYTNWLREAS